MGMGRPRTPLGTAGDTRVPHARAVAPPWGQEGRGHAGCGDTQGLGTLTSNLLYFGLFLWSLVRLRERGGRGVGVSTRATRGHPGAGRWPVSPTSRGRRPGSPRRSPWRGAAAGGPPGAPWSAPRNPSCSSGRGTAPWPAPPAGTAGTAWGHRGDMAGTEAGNGDKAKTRGWSWDTGLGLVGHDGSSGREIQDWGTWWHHGDTAGTCWGHCGDRDKARTRGSGTRRQQWKGDIGLGDMVAPWGHDGDTMGTRLETRTRGRDMGMGLVGHGGIMGM